MAEHQVAYLPTGTYKADCVLSSKSEAPCVVSLSCEKLSGSGVREVQFHIPVGSGTILSDLRKITPEDLIVGSTKIRFSSNKNAEGRAPLGSFNLFDVSLIEEDRILVVVARYWTNDDEIAEAKFCLQYATDKIGRRFASAVEEWLLKEGSIEKFLAARAYLDAEIAKEIDHVIPCPNFGVALALACLEKNLFNRGLNVAYLERYISDLKAKAWGRPSDAICFSKCGHLIEGGHRSIATVIADAEGYQSLAFNFEKDAMKNFNKGAARNEAGNHDIKQRMQMVEGVAEGDLDLTKLQKGKEYTKVIRNMILIQTETNSKNNRAYLDAFTTEYYSDLVWYNSVEPSTRATFIRKDNGIIGACFVLAHRKYPDIVAGVFEKVTSAAGLIPGTALHTLYTVLANEAQENSKGNLSLGLAAKIFICLHRHVEHELAEHPAEYTFVKGRKTDSHRKQARAFFTHEVTDTTGRAHRTFLPKMDPEITLASEAAE